MKLKNQYIIFFAAPDSAKKPTSDVQNCFEAQEKRTGTGTGLYGI
jgi:hypothetical protein